MPRSRLAAAVAALLLVVFLEWYSRPGMIESLEAPMLRNTTESLIERAIGLEKEIAGLVRLLGKAEKGKGVVEGTKDRVIQAYDDVEQYVRQEEGSLETGDERNFDRISDWIEGLGPDCREPEKNKKTKKQPPAPKHPIGGGEAEINYEDLENPNTQKKPKSDETFDETIEDPCADTEDHECRRSEIRTAFKNSWKAYKSYAWGHDELRPSSKGFRNWGDKGIGLTLIDAMPSLWLLGFKREFNEAVQWVDEEMDLNIEGKVSQFEVIIRVIGGLISAYEVSGEQHTVLIKKAALLADKVLHAYQTNNGIPDSTIDLQTLESSNSVWNSGSAVLSELASIQLELRTLSYHTGNPYYDQVGTWLIDFIDSRAPADYLCPTFLDKESGKWGNDHVTLGAMGDSYYEYLLKQYLLTGKTEERYKMMYQKSVSGIQKKLLKRSEPSGQTYLAEMKRGGVYNKMDHLACFAGGMLSLGSEEASSDHDENINKIAEGLAETCHLMYSSQQTGLSPELVMFRGGGDMEKVTKGSYYILRPETAETYMYLSRFTGKQKYREWGWELFKSANKWCKTGSGGFSGIRDVGVVPPVLDDIQQSFWLAETLKYLFVLFSPDDAVIDFTKWVLNTEGHPLKIRKRQPLDLWSKEAVAAREVYLAKHADDRLESFKPFPVVLFSQKTFDATRARNLKQNKPTNDEDHDDDTDSSYDSSSGSDGSDSDSESGGGWSSRLARLRKKGEEAQ
eukprot:TRINITY_DN5318_c0_g1_i1.p1 TRINITY_DN5318_c0_g1~~TRINITY_DN5318_c0_g1_i1.p1  ORF type:complete len:753 (+),score=143.89 TRINITY_DN5318_c0_g1_i1:55-2259(+)